MPPESHITALRDDSPELHANVVQLCFLQIFEVNLVEILMFF